MLIIFHVQNAENRDNIAQSFKYLINICGDVIYILKTNNIHNRCKAINLAPVNQAVIFIPKPQVLLNISTKHNPNQIKIANNITFIILSKCATCRTSIIATEIRSISIASSIIETGIGMLIFLNGIR